MERGGGINDYPRAQTLIQRWYDMVAFWMHNPYHEVCRSGFQTRHHRWRLRKPPYDLCLHIMTVDPDETRTAINTALDALERGDRATAQRLAWLAVALAPGSETPWLILAVMASPEESLAYIKKALQINPESKPALQALQWALDRQFAQPIEPEPEPSREQIALPTSPAVPAEPPQEQIQLPTPAPAIPAEPPPEQVQLPTPAPAIPAKPPISVSQSSPPVTERRKFSLSPIRILLFILLGLVVIALITGLTFLRPQFTGMLARFFPGEDCRPSLVLDSRSFEIRTLKPGSDGSLDVPRNQPERAYWVEGTDTNRVFGLSPVPDNLSLVSSLKPEAAATVTGVSCNTVTYSLSAPLQGLPDNASLLDQSTSQITIFIPADAASSGTVIRGELQEETITALNTPDVSALQAEISLLDTTTSPDGSTLTVGISIYNYGQTAATLSTSDVSLTPDAASPLAPVRVEPPLPIEIGPGTTKTIYLTFLRPSTTTATLKVFTVEYELEGY